MYRTLPVIILNQPLQGEADPNAKQRRLAVGAYFPIMIVVLYIIHYLTVSGVVNIVQHIVASQSNC